MKTLAWIIVVVAFIQGVWLVFDGTRALVVGDYVTAKSGPYAGTLGPWSRVVSAAGLDPRGRVMKWTHVVLGVAWLAALAIFVVRPPIGWWFVAGCAAATLWYLPIGTILGIVVLALLFAPSMRSMS